MTTARRLGHWKVDVCIYVFQIILFVINSFM